MFAITALGSFLLMMNSLPSESELCLFGITKQPENESIVMPHIRSCRL